jgi:histidinol-phosphate aminotransferase
MDAAEAAIRDIDYTNHCRRENEKWRTWLANGLSEIGVPSDVSQANFILARFANQAEAEGCDAYLQAQGLVVRRVAGYNLPNALRITVGDESACRQVLHSVRNFKAGSK